MSHECPVVIAHRGDTRSDPENSMAAFREAVRNQHRAIEFDIHLTRDGAPVVLHDPTLDRTTNGQGAVCDATWLKVSRLVLQGSNEGVPRLEEVLALIASSQADVVVEVKSRADGGRYEGVAALLSEELERAGMRSRCMVTAFDWDVLAELQSTWLAARGVGVIAARHLDTPGALPQALQKLADLGVRRIGIEHGAIDEDVVRRAGADGIDVGAWTVNDVVEMQRLARCGVKWIISDRPEQAVKAFPGYFLRRANAPESAQREQDPPPFGRTSQ